MVEPETSLVDPFGRTINYLRLSVTDRCNFRCVYCMAEEMTFLPKSSLLSFEEITQIVGAFVALGVKKVRLTGGEPLVRRDIVRLVERLKRFDRLNELTMTTNAARLSSLAPALKSAGIDRLNISLDTLDKQYFRAISRTGNLDDVLAGIDAAILAEFSAIKLNAVILNGQNDQEVLALLEYALEKGIDITFIEEMPLGTISSHQRSGTYYSSDQVKAQIESRYRLLPNALNTGGPARYFSVEGAQKTRVGFISPHSNNFCASCNRVRMTAEGQLLLCLGNENAVDLRDFVRRYPNQSEKLKQHLQKAMRLKPEKHEFSTEQDVHILRFMNMTGG